MNCKTDITAEETIIDHFRIRCHIVAFYNSLSQYAVSQIYEYTLSLNENFLHNVNVYNFVANLCISLKFSAIVHQVIQFPNH